MDEELCWFCGTNPPDGKAITVVGKNSSGAETHPIQLPRCRRCRRLDSWYESRSALVCVGVFFLWIAAIPLVLIETVGVYLYIAAFVGLIFAGNFFLRWRRSKDKVKTISEGCVGHPRVQQPRSIGFVFDIQRFLG